MEASSTDLLLNDEQLPEDIRKNIQPFLGSDFAPQNYSREVVQQSSLSLGENLAIIEASILALDTSLKNQVLDDHDQLTANVSAIDVLDVALTDLDVSVSQLLSLSSATLDQLRGTFQNFSNRVDAFEKSRKAAELLRSSNRIVQTAKRLRACLEENNFDYARAAMIIQDVEPVSEDSELRSLEFLSADLKYISKTVKDFPAMIVRELERSINEQNMVETGKALDACLIIGRAEEASTRLTELFIRNIEASIQEGLDIQQLISQGDIPYTNATTNATTNKNARLPGRTTLPSVQNSPALRTVFWSKVSSIFDAVYQNQLRIELMESVYVRRYEEHSLYRYVLDAKDIDEGRISKDFIARVSSAIKSGLEKCGKESGFAQQTLENDFPKLLKIVKDTSNRIRTTSLYLEDSDIDSLRRSIKPFEELFVSRSLSRLLDPVNIVIADNSALPTDEDLNGIYRAVTMEISICSVDQVLASLCLRNVSKTLRTAFVKLEGLIATDGEATQVTGNISSKQQTNFKIVNLSVKIAEETLKIIETKIQNKKADVKNLTDEISSASHIPVSNALNPLIASLVDSVEAILLTMHDEDFSAGQHEADVETMEILDSTGSLYMRELHQFLSRAQQTFLSQINPRNAFLRGFISRFARRCLELFVRHTSLLRPVGKQGRLKLAADFAQMEAALAPLNLHSSEYGKELQVLKEFRPLLFQSPAQMVGNPSVGLVVPYSVVLCHLFSRAPMEVQSPHRVAGWSVSRYSRFLDEHPSEREKLLVIQNSLESYAQLVRNRGETHYAAIYPLMKDMLTVALEASQ
ncbi:hypothetical protein RvY_18289 [Ramazzottius varieornatus]|uniref:Conserved oligomeric Golgi complex subunit 5 n=1 Tax=Ramazzottius varieornatus TaxID=947166 RepID=A0A1D1WA79_RAMVA|nr:hypothetical protein RvY_18289 [Ramazzottius varieornatus]